MLKIQYFCLIIDRDESAMIITAPASINVSFNTRRPAPDKYGKPWCKSPSGITHASGVVIKNDNVTIGVANASTPPINPNQRLTGLASTSNAISTSTTPRPLENV